MDYLFEEVLSIKLTLFLVLHFQTGQTYRSSPKEAKEIQRQVDEFLQKGFVRKSLSLCYVPMILVPKKDGTWRMSIDCRAINKITVNYRYSIPRLDDMLDELHGSCVFSRIEL